MSGLRIVVGIACLVLGIAALAWPDLSLVVLAVILRLQIVIAGVAQILVGLRLRTGPSLVRQVVIVLGGLVALAGVIVMVRPGPALVVLVWFLAGAWLVEGFSEIISGLRMGRPGGERIMTIAFGVTSVTAALILFVFPGPQPDPAVPDRGRRPDRPGDPRSGRGDPGPAVTPAAPGMSTTGGPRAGATVRRSLAIRLLISRRCRPPAINVSAIRHVPAVLAASRRG